MPRNGSGVYNLPPGTPGVPDTPVESAPYNIFIADIENDLNLPRPIVAGGTGASTPSAALANLGGFPLTGGTLTGDVAISKTSPQLSLIAPAAGQSRAIVGYLNTTARWSMALGNADPESGSNAGSNFMLQRHADNGTPIDISIGIARDTGKISLSGSVLINDPSLEINSPGDATIKLVKNASGKFNNIIGYTFNQPRWQMQLGNVDAESSGELGSNFSIDRFNDSGVYIDSPLAINRATGLVSAPKQLQVGNVGFGSAPNIGQIAASVCSAVTGHAFNTFINAGGSSWCPMTTGHGAVWSYVGATGQLDYYTSSASASPGGTHSMTQRLSIAANGLLTLNDINAYYAAQGHLGLVIYGYASGGSYTYSTCIRSNLNYGTLELGAFYVTSVLASMRFTVSASYFDFRHDGQAYKAGGGSWGDTSDARVKTVKRPYSSGLDAILSLQPVVYTFKGNASFVAPDDYPTDKDGKPLERQPNIHAGAAAEGKEFIGLLAQNAELMMPEMVTKMPGYIDGSKVDDLRQLDVSPLVFALVNAVKELAARVEQLESSM